MQKLELCISQKENEAAETKKKNWYICEEQLNIFGWKNSFLNPIIFKGVGKVGGILR